VQDDLPPPGELRVTCLGNHCTGRLLCGLCDGLDDVEFYEGGANHKLDGPLLWVAHYDKCRGVDARVPISIRLTWADTTRAVVMLTLDPVTRALI
jgi:hypothetical protein